MPRRGPSLLCRAPGEPGSYHGPNNGEKRKAQVGKSLFSPLRSCPERDVEGATVPAYTRTAWAGSPGGEDASGGDVAPAGQAGHGE